MGIPSSMSLSRLLSLLVCIGGSCGPAALAEEATAASTALPSFDRRLLLEDPAFTSANVSIGDVDRDGKLDLILVKGRHWPLQNLLLRGDGRGHFQAPEPAGPGPDRSYTAELVDLDKDGDLDLVVSNDSPDPKRILHNDGAGRFREVQAFGEPHWNTRHVSVLDANGDGLLDVIAANRGAEATESFLCLGLPRGPSAPRARATGRPSWRTSTETDTWTSPSLPRVPVPARTDAGTTAVATSYRSRRRASTT